MKCAACQHDNETIARFCEECGGNLAFACASCGTELKPTAKFCLKCGAQTLAFKAGDHSPVDGVADGTPKPAKLDPLSHATSAGERRHLTVMFCDLVGSTALSEQLDPEDLHSIVSSYQDACRQVIDRYEGHIAQYLGDGVLVYFGYPSAHEDDAVRGVRAGLDILAALQKIELDHPIQARIGVHTGPVMVGAIGSAERTEHLAMGDTPNIASRVQGQTAPKTIAISGDTYRLVQGFFACKYVGAKLLKGLSSAQEIYEVISAGQAQSRFDVSVQKGLTPLVAREEEIELLLRRWERAKNGEGQVVLISGEPGIGKSRLLQVLRDYCDKESHLSVVCRCAPFYQNTALYPVIEHLQRALQLGKEDDPATMIRTLAGSLDRAGMNNDETVALFATLLSIPIPDIDLRLPYSAQKKKEKTFEALANWICSFAVQRPVRLEFEDLHWADASTLELLDLLVDRAASSKILVLLTFRPEFVPSWQAQAHTLQMHLNRLPQRDIAAMVLRVAGKAMPEEVVQQLLIKSDGVPLYIEEMTKNLVESGLMIEAGGQYELAGPVPDMVIPVSLQDSFTARLDRLGSARELAQIGAVLGRGFAYDLILTVSMMDESKLQEGLSRLKNAEILFQRGATPDATYTFKHALLQETAYNSLLKSDRRRFHSRTAVVLEQHFPEMQESQPELLAHHFTEANLAEQAIPYWQRAGESAIQRSANKEAVGHLKRGLDALLTLPATSERDRQELALQVALGAPIIATQGFAAAEAGKVYTRARKLCEQTEATPETFPALWGLYAFHFVRADHKTARELGEQLLILADSQQDTALLLQAHLALGYSLYPLGEFRAANAHLQDARALYDARQHHALAFTYGSFDPGVAGLCYEALTTWVLGYPDKALKKIQQARTLANELSHPFSLAAAANFSAMLHHYRREADAVGDQADGVISLCTEQGFPFYLAWGTIFRGWALTEQGHHLEGGRQLREGLAAWRATGAELWWSHFLALSAEQYGQGGQAEEGLSSVDEALASIKRTEERHYEAELFRLKGEFLLQQPGHTVPQVIECFQQAIEIARRQQAKSWELRAATSLARLRLGQDEATEAYELLAPVYDWFTEGFDTADLQDAKALLEELA